MSSTIDDSDDEDFELPSFPSFSSGGLMDGSSTTHSSKKGSNVQDTSPNNVSNGEKNSKQEYFILPVILVDSYLVLLSHLLKRPNTLPERKFKGDNVNFLSYVLLFLHSIVYSCIQNSCYEK